MIRIRGLCKAFAGTPVLTGIDATVEAGKIVALLGASGSGKSTLLRCLNGLETFDAGSLEIGDFTLSSGAHAPRLLQALRFEVGMVFQEFHLFSHLNVLDNVTLAPRVVRGMRRADAEAKAMELLEQVGLADRAQALPRQLSGGQKQRVALARALINQPKVLLLDEPLGALDLKLREEMQLELRNLQRRLGITFIYVTHDQGEALSMSDRVAVFNNGRIEQMAPARELYSKPRTPFVARFVGGANVVEGEAAQRVAGVSHPFAVRPESVQVFAASGAAPSGFVSADGTVLDVQFHGATSRWQVKLDAGDVFTATVNAGNSSQVPEAPGERVRLAWSREAMVMLEAA